jgi:hypothetical protein
MPEEKIVLGEPDTGKLPDPQPSGPAPDGQPQDAPPQNIGDLEKFKKPDGSVDYAKLQEAYVNVEKEKGRLGNEVGELRKATEQYNQFFANEYVQVGDQWVHKSQLRTREPEPPPRNDAQPSQEEINERLRQALADDPATVFNALLKSATNAALAEQTRREKVLSNPLAQKDAEIKSLAIDYMNKGYGEEEAIAIAVGKRAMAMANGQPPNGGPSTFTLPSTLSIPNRTFMQPNGQPPASAPKKPELTAEQRQWAIRLGRDPEKVAQYLERK